ncbi:MAG: hypothetical protein M3P85_04580 [Actinomycetota bacterium]|jgi:hypothetical protein|nr:hypothetical protein [Actinomycetota bacterium]PLS75333.1 MAG: hypothetical protein CYG61_07895 [Actinomycetota bacterium]
MSNPQQPEIRRSGRGEVVQDAVKTRHGGPTDETGNTGPVPEDNQPGHHPEVDQDKPTAVPEAYQAPE